MRKILLITLLSVSCAALFPATPPETIAEARLARGLGSLQPEPEPASDPEALLDEVRACLDHLRSLLERDIP